MENNTAETKEVLSGIIVFLPSDTGSKSEAVLPKLYRGFGVPLVRLMLKGDNPFENSSLRPYDGHRVSLVGVFSPSGTFNIQEIKTAKNLQE